MNTEAPNDVVEWASWNAYILVANKKEIESWLEKQGRLDTFSEAMGDWRVSCISNDEDWERTPDKAVRKASEVLYKICKDHGLCEVVETRYGPTKDAVAPRQVRTRGRVGLPASAEQSLFLEETRKRLQELAKSIA